MVSRTAAARRVVAPAFFVLVAASLVGGIAGGLLRAGVALPPWPAAGHAAVAHAALMICGFFGTVIGIERAVAVKLRWAFVAPAASAAGGLAWLAGAADAAVLAGVVAALVFVAVNVVVVRRQRAAHTVLLLASAIVWLVGNLALALAASPQAALPWWFAFLVMTVAAERLEMTRLMRRRPAAQPALIAILALLLAGAALHGAVFGLALVALAAWLATFDIARRTVHAQGLPRYMALCLLGGYAWLAVGGFAWAGEALGAPTRDAALHALGLGFIVSMVMGHAPVILPAVARVKLAFGRSFYLPLALLHASLLMRLVPGWRTTGASLNAAAIGLFAVTMLVAGLRWRATGRLT